MQLSDLNHCQSVHILNLTHGIIREGTTTNLQFSQSWAILQIEMTIWIHFIFTGIISHFCETTLSNHHSLQVIQSNQFQFFCPFKTLIAHFQFPQMYNTRHIKYLPFPSITTLITHNQFLYAGEQKWILIRYCHSHFRWLIIHPLSITCDNTPLVILNASSPSLSFKDHSFILNHSNIRIVASAVAHIHISNSESLIHHSVLTVIQHTPTIWLIV